MGTYKFIDHTADIAIVLDGDSLNDLFETAFYAFKEIVINTNDSNVSDDYLLDLCADNYEELLISFLSELNYLILVKKCIIKSIDSLQINEYNLTCNILFDNFNPRKHIIKEEIKAVTYHQFMLEHTEGSYKAKIVFDI